jgi:hypothetical protein
MLKHLPSQYHIAQNPLPGQLKYWGKKNSRLNIQHLKKLVTSNL